MRTLNKALIECKVLNNGWSFHNSYYDRGSLKHFFRRIYNNSKLTISTTRRSIEGIGINNNL